MKSVKLINNELHLLGLRKTKYYLDKKVFTNIPSYWCENCDVTSQFHLKLKAAKTSIKELESLITDLKQVNDFDNEYCSFSCHKCKQDLVCIYGIHEFAMSSYVYFPQKLYLIEDISCLGDLPAQSKP